MRIGEHVIGVCSWSLGRQSTGELLELLNELGLSHLQIDLRMLDGKSDKEIVAAAERFEAAGVELTAGMVSFPGEDYRSIAAIRETGGLAQDSRWTERLALLKTSAATARRLGLKLVSTHIGFLPASSGPTYPVMIDRAQKAADVFAEYGLTLLMETGQEAASELLQCFNDIARPNVGMNFDPANMILYGAGDPVDAVRVLGRHVKHVHIKDAIASEQPGVLWGQEVPFGSGQVNAMACLDELRLAGYHGPLVIERTAGGQHLDEIKAAIEILSQLLSPSVQCE